MKVYIVCIDRVDTVPSECSYDEDGYYDDYYDEEFHSTEVVCVCDKEDLAQKLVDIYQCSAMVRPDDTVFYMPFHVLKKSDFDADLLKEALTVPTKEQLEALDKKLELAKKVFKE